MIQIRINDPLWIPGSPRFACRCWRDQFVEQLAQDRAIKGQFIRDKQGLALTAGGQIFQHPSGIIQSAPTNPELNQQARIAEEVIYLTDGGGQGLEIRDLEKPYRR